MLRRINLGFGILLFFVFLATGWYMKNIFAVDHLEELVRRMEIRSNHIYILFIALLNILAFKKENKDAGIISKWFSYFFHLLLLIAGITSVLAFLYDHTGDLNERAYSSNSVFLAFGAVCCVLLEECFSWFYLSKTKAQTAATKDFSLK